jgi:hypothetical protein
MKNILLLSILFFSIPIFAQDKIKILYHKDIMTDTESIFTQASISSENQKKGFFIKPTFSIKNGVFAYSGLFIKSFGLGTCLEKDELTILFEDSTKINLISWSKFNCNGESYFDLDGSNLKNLTKRIKAIRFQNGKSFEALTLKLENENDKTFFIHVQQAIDKQVYEEVANMEN